MPDSIDVRNECGCVLACGYDEAEQHHRWWFDVTAAGRLVFISEVIHFEDMDRDAAGLDGRHYVDEDEAEVPPKVETALADAGYDQIVSTDGFLL